MLRVMSLVAQWKAIATGFPETWSDAQLRLGLDRPEQVNRASALLGPIGPGRSGDGLSIRVTATGASGPATTQRLLSRLDDEGITGHLALAGPPTEAAVALAGAATSTRAASGGSLADAWDDLVAELPSDWSDLLCALDLHSSDELAPAALAIAPLNPSRLSGQPAFRFRVARRFGYGAAPQMARRCLARLDEAGTRGNLRLLEALSDTQPVATQGPTFVVESRAV
jgi:hypothetical protein